MGWVHGHRGIRATLRIFGERVVLEKVLRGLYAPPKPLVFGGHWRHAKQRCSLGLAAYVIARRFFSDVVVVRAGAAGFGRRLADLQSEHGD